MSKHENFQPGNTYSCKYKEEYGAQMLAYFNDMDEPYPTFELFAESIGVTNDTLLNWRKKYTGFRNYYARCKNIQKGRTLSGGMTGRYNPQIVKFMAINNFDMSEKIENNNDVTFKVVMPDAVDEESD